MLCFFHDPHGVSINSTSEEVRSDLSPESSTHSEWFPLIQLPRKSEDCLNKTALLRVQRVSINSTSEEVRSVLSFLPTDA